MKNKLLEIEQWFDRVLQEVPDPGEQCSHLLRLYHDLVLLLTEASQLHFNTLFARVSFISSRYPLGKAWSYAMQIPRRELHHRELTDEALQPIVAGCISYLLALCHHEINGAPPTVSIDVPDLPALPPMRKRGRQRKPFVRGIAVEWFPEIKQLHLLEEEEPDTSKVMQYDVQGVNDIFSETLEMALREIGLPLVLGLSDVEYAEDGVLTPSYIVILPDLLLDVTAVAQMHSDGPDPAACNILDLFMPSRNTLSLLTGHVANYILDALVRDPSKPYPDLFREAFRMYPVEFARLSDDALREMNRTMQQHHAHILQVLEERFPDLGIERRQCLIEPSFFSPQYGIKGRLDLYFENRERRSASIVELKSSRPFMPNPYGLSHSHYHQTLLYDLLIRHSHPADMRRSNFILYSILEEDSLKYAVNVEAIQKETIHNRNQAVLLQHRLMRLDDTTSRDVPSEVDPVNYQHLKGFLRTHVAEWHSVFSVLSAGEQMYFKAFAAFVSREHTLARIGSDRGEGTGGLAGLWLDPLASKEERYSILQKLILLEIVQDQDQTTIRFERSNITHPLANFRAGDIAVMYPFEEGIRADPTRYQLHRATILMIDAGQVTIRLRNSQVHTRQIEEWTYWNLEPDMLDSSFKALYQSLWHWMSARPAIRHTLLGLIPPDRLLETQLVPVPEGLSVDQSRIYREGIHSSPLYLLWGPPGTGKTSMMLRGWVWYYFHHTPARITLLAYTNRAVDEICEALHHLGPDVSNHYIRIGSRAATGEAYRHRLLDQLMAPLQTRAEIVQLLQSTRIYVGTVASMQGKNELFQLIDFDLLIMDEASQVLEPAIVGLLTRYKKSILIGDHMQLPAISVQSSGQSQIRHDQHWPKRIGLTDMRMSYFERLYRLYQEKGWFQAIGMLCEQGRMHQDIQAFVNRHVYNGILRLVNPQVQSATMSTFIGVSDSPWMHAHLVFIPTGSSWPELYSRTNEQEARMVLHVLQQWQQMIHKSALRWSIGIVTPFRAQIASIQHMAHLRGISLEDVTVDTVERFQGGARDIMIMSCAVNAESMLDRIVSVNPEGVDRKLNVAVTRARRQFVLIGDEAILRKEPAYAGLIDMSSRWEPNEVVDLHP